jgi:hypothetical protein
VAVIVALLELSHPFALAVIVVALGGCFAAIAPPSGFRGFVKNWAISVVILCGLMALGVTVGAIMRDFLLEMQ